MVDRLVSRPERNALERMERFIDEARHDCAAFGMDLPWSDAVWDVRAHCPKPVGKSGQTAMIYFTTHNNGTAKNVDGRTSLEEPFSRFLKAVVRRKQDGKPQSHDPLARIANAGRYLHDQLHNRRHDPVRLTHADFAAAAIAVQKRLSPTTAYRFGTALQEIGDTIDRHGLTVVRIDWRNPISRVSNGRSRISSHAEAVRKDRLPDPFILDEIARLSHVVTTPRDIVRMAHVKLSHCAPWRTGEILALLADCEIEEPAVDQNGPILTEDGRPLTRYGLRYWKAKSINADVKWIPTIMVDAAKAAVSDIRRHTEPARELARWLEANPGRARLSGDDLGPDQMYSVEDVTDMLGMSRLSSGRAWLKYRNLHPAPSSRSSPVIRRRDLELVLLNNMVEVAPDRRGAHLSQHLFLTFQNFYGAKISTNPCVLAMTRDQHISDFLCGRGTGRCRVQSVFERHASVMPDGSPIRITTHQFRHWLNTLAQAGGLDQVLIARWSGRKQIGQNGEYDHLTGIELADKFKGMMEDGKILGPLADLHQRKAPKDRKGFRDTVFATAHITDIGMCDLDWITSTCPEFSACESCEFCVVVKGDEAARERVAWRRGEHAWQLERTETEVDDGTIGASNHASSLRASVAGCDRIIAIHDDSTILDGTLVQPVAASPDHYAGPRLKTAV